ncbi:hypothetical protein BGZ97_005770, partial [Linnemannia gamsii]
GSQGPSQLEVRPVSAYLTAAHFEQYFRDPPFAAELEDPLRRETAVAAFIEQESQRASPPVRSNYRKLVFTSGNFNQPRIFMAALFLQEYVTLMGKSSDPNCTFSVTKTSNGRLFQILATNLGCQFPEWFKGVTAMSIFGVYWMLVSKAQELERFQASATENRRAGWTPTRMSRIAIDLLEFERESQKRLQGRSNGERTGEAARSQRPEAHQLPERRVDDGSLWKHMPEGTVEREEGEARRFKRETTSKAESEGEEEGQREMDKENVLESESIAKPEFKDNNLPSNNTTVNGRTRAITQASNTDSPSSPPRNHTAYIRADSAGSSDTGIGGYMVHKQSCQQPQHAERTNGGQDVGEGSVATSSGKVKATTMVTTKGLLDIVAAQAQTIQDLMCDEVRLEEFQKIKDSTDVIAGLKETVAGLTEETRKLKQESVGIKVENEGLKEKVAGLAEETRKLKQKSVGIKVENEGLKEKVAGLAEETRELKQESVGIKVENEALKKETVALKEKNTGMKEEISHLRSQDALGGGWPSKWMASLLSLRTSFSRWWTNR